jgi:hypothetical protein
MSLTSRILLQRIAGRNNRREIMETASITSPRVDHVFAQGIANVPQSEFDGDTSTVLHEGFSTDAPHDYYYRFGYPVTATSFQVVNAYVGTLEGFAYDDASTEWVSLGTVASATHDGDTNPAQSPRPRRTWSKKPWNSFSTLQPVKLQIFQFVATSYDDKSADKTGYTGFAESMIHGARGQLSLNSPRQQLRARIKHSKTDTITSQRRHTTAERNFKRAFHIHLHAFISPSPSLLFLHKENVYFSCQSTKS